MADKVATSLRCVLLCFLVLFFNVGHALDLPCIEVKREYVKKGFSENDVPIQEIAGDHLSICEQSMTCCTSDMEGKLRSLSTKEYDSVSNEAFRFIKSTFISRTKKFDDFFKELLDNSKNDLDEMFVRTYGLFYKRNDEVFLDLFKDLKSYYQGLDVNLVTLLNDFFRELLLKMFALLNRGYEFDESYLQCVSQHMDALKPFGDVPTKLKLQVKRAFIAARTFVQGLAIGRDVILAMEKIPPTDACTRGLMKMMYCPHCRGLTSTKPCNNYCLNTMKGCLAQHSELNKAWNEYIEALKMVALRLEGPFNIETVVGPMDVEISEAIMNLQESAEDITSKIFKGCGQPRMAPDSRNKREANPADDETKRDTSYEDYQYGNFLRENNRGAFVRPTTASGTSLDRLVRDIKIKVKEAMDFWVQLPYTICNSPDFSAQPDQDGDCWNGQDRARYVHEVQKDGRIHQANNPEVTYDTQDDNGFVMVQIKNLKVITGKLQNAYNGIEVESEDPIIDIEGSGIDNDDDDGYDVEGSGRPNRKGNDDDDVEDGSGSGSGAGMDSDDEDNNGRKGGKRPNTDKDPVRDFGFDHPEYKTTKPDSRTTDSSAACTVPSVTVMLVAILSCLQIVFMRL